MTSVVKALISAVCAVLYNFANLCKTGFVLNISERNQTLILKCLVFLWLSVCPRRRCWTPVGGMCPAWAAKLLSWSPSRCHLGSLRASWSSVLCHAGHGGSGSFGVPLLKPHSQVGASCGLISCPTAALVTLEFSPHVLGPPVLSKHAVSLERRHGCLEVDWCISSGLRISARWIWACLLCGSVKSF